MLQEYLNFKHSCLYPQAAQKYTFCILNSYVTSFSMQLYSLLKKSFPEIYFTFSTILGSQIPLLTAKDFPDILFCATSDDIFLSAPLGYVQKFFTFSQISNMVWLSKNHPLAQYNNISAEQAACFDIVAIKHLCR